MCNILCVIFRIVVHVFIVVSCNTKFRQLYTSTFLVYPGKETIQSFLKFDCWSKKPFMIESFLCPDKQGTPEEGWKIQRPKHCVTTNNNKDKDNSSKNHT